LRKTDGVLVGRCGFSDAAIEAIPQPNKLARGWFSRTTAPADLEMIFEPELGYTFGREYWGHGYATEAVGCVFNYARGVLKLPKMMSLIHAENVRSLKLAGRFALRRIDTIEVLSRPFDRYEWPAF